MAVVLSTSLRLLVRPGAGDAARDGLVLRFPRLTPKDPLDTLSIHSKRTETKIQHVRIDCTAAGGQIRSRSKVVMIRRPGLTGSLSAIMMVLP